MQEILDDHVENPQLTDKEIFTKIWFSPREVFRFINDNKYDNHVNILLIFAGMFSVFNRAIEKNLGDKLELWQILAFGFIGGGLLGWISYYLFATGTSLTGKWLKAKGTTASILRMFAYAATPTFISLIIIMLLIIIYGDRIFTADGIFDSNGDFNYIIVAFGILQVILGIWTIILVVIGTSEVQKLSIPKAILNLILPILVFLVPIVVIVIMINTSL